MAFEVRPCRDRDELVRAHYAIGSYFGAPIDEERIERVLQLLELDRLHAAFDGGGVVGGAGAFSFDLTVPGGALPCAGVTLVGVYPTHRRRGVLRAMMEAQLADVHERGEPIAALWASEETIYGRFGYGLSSWSGEIELRRVWSAYAQPLERRGQTRFVTAEEAAVAFPPVWDALRRERPGVISRTEAWWRLRQLRIPDEEKANPRRFVALDLDGSTQAYAIYRTSLSFEAGVSTSALDVQEAVGATPQATAEIWRFLLDIDWIETVRARILPLDHPLFLLLATPRRTRFRIGDALWTRLVDVGAALSGRASAGDGAVVFDVQDAVCPWNEGRWRVADGEAARTDAEPDLALDVSALGSAYLGAVSFGELRAAGRLEELRDGAVQRADALFTWRPLPWCPEIF